MRQQKAHSVIEIHDEILSFAILHPNSLSCKGQGEYR